MITSKHIKEILNTLVKDETFCRLVTYGSNPLDEEFPNVIGSSDFDEIVKDRIKFSPQIYDLDGDEKTRVCIYKSFTKIRVVNSVIREEIIKIDLYVPHRLVEEDFRVYDIENKIISLIDGMQLGIGSLDYEDGTFVPLPPVTGYAVYKMSFTMQDGRRRLNGKY